MTNLLIILTILSSFLTNLETKTLQSDFTVTVAEEVNAPMNYNGHLTMHGRQFMVDMMGMEAAYDGKTMYMYNADVDELTISEPTKEELLEANPFLYAKALVEVCNVTERATDDGKQTIITLTPKDQAIGIKRFTLRVSNDNLMPIQLEMKEAKNATTLKMTNPRYVEAPQKWEIVPEKSTFVNDMRL